MKTKCRNELIFGVGGLTSKGLECQNTPGHNGAHFNHTKAETCNYNIEYTVHWEEIK